MPENADSRPPRESFAITSVHHNRSPARDILHYLRVFQGYLGARMYLVFALMLVATLAEGMGILMLPPLLGLDMAGGATGEAAGAADTAPDGVSGALQGLLGWLGMADSAVAVTAWVVVFPDSQIASHAFAGLPEPPAALM